MLADEPQLIRAAPVTSKSTVGAALFTPTRPVVVIAVLADEPQLIRAAPVTSKSTVGAALFTPMRPVVVIAIPVVAVDVILAAATDASPAISNRTPGVFVPIPILPIPSIIIRSVPPVTIRTELLYFLPVAWVLTPVKSIQLFAEVCALKRRNPELSNEFTPLISFTD